MNITIVTDARTDAEAMALLRHMGMPFRSRQAASAARRARSGDRANG